MAQVGALFEGSQGSCGCSSPSRRAWSRKSGSASNLSGDSGYTPLCTDRMNGLAWAGRELALLPEAPVFEDLAQDYSLSSLDKGDDFHRAATVGAQPRVGLVYAFDEHGPAGRRVLVRDALGRETGLRRADSNCQDDVPGQYLYSKCLRRTRAPSCQR